MSDKLPTVVRCRKVLKTVESQSRLKQGLDLIRKSHHVPDEEIKHRDGHVCKFHPVIVKIAQSMMQDNLDPVEAPSAELSKYSIHVIEDTMKDLGINGGLAPIPPVLPPKPDHVKQAKVAFESNDPENPLNRDDVRIGVAIHTLLVTASQCARFDKQPGADSRMKLLETTMEAYSKVV